MRNMQKKPYTDSDNEVAAKSIIYKKSDAEISKMVANVMLKNVDPFSCVLEADSRYKNFMCVPKVASSLEISPAADTQTPPSIKIPSTILQTSSAITITPSEENAVIIPSPKDTVSVHVCNCTDAFKAEMLTFKNEIVKEIKDQIAAEFEKYNFQQVFQTVVDSMALIQAKCDALGRDSVPASNQVITNIPQDQRPPRPNLFDKIVTVHGLKALNERAKDPEYVTEYVDQMSIHFGKDTCIKKGRSAAMKLIDKTVDRAVFKEFCWTGKAKGREKCKFGDLRAFIYMFYLAVRYSDPTFTIDDNENFLRSCLSNSGSRADKPDPIIQQSQRKRAKKDAASDGPIQIVRVLSNDEVLNFAELNVGVLPNGEEIQLIYNNSNINNSNNNIE